MAAKVKTDDMLDSYMLENQQLIEKLQEIALSQKDETCFSDEAIHEIFRTVHTIKGSSGVMMFDGITVVAHKLEDIFYILREFHPAEVPHLQLVEHVLTVADYITAELEKLQKGEATIADSEEMLEKLDAFLKIVKGKVEEEKQQELEKKAAEIQKFYIAPVTNQATKHYYVKLTYKEGVSLINIRAYKAVYALKELADEVIYSPEELISDESTIEEIRNNGFQILVRTQAKESELRSFFEQRREIAQIELRSCSEEEYEQGFATVKEDLFFIDLDASIEEIEARAERSQEKIISESKTMALVPGDFVIQTKDLGKTKKLVREAQKRAEKSAYIPVEMEKIEKLSLLVDRLQTSLSGEELEILAKDLKQAVRSMRMVNFSQTFQKMNRLVFDVSRNLGKEVLFLYDGEEVEVDRNLMEMISDSLMHLIRNSLDHGVEMPIDRLVVGKPEKATITISAMVEEQVLSVAVIDDGKGLNRLQILERAKEQGILGSEKAESDYTDREVYQLITAPGFSLSQQVTEYSGRGVGMDAVASNVSAMGGTLEIESENGRGTKMTMRIPLKWL